METPRSIAVPSALGPAGHFDAMTPDDEKHAFERIENPFITGTPVSGSTVFFGREDDFAYVQERLITEKDGIVLLFVGGRRSGKTSIMFQILQGRLGDDFVPVFIDMQQLASIHGDAEFLSRVADLTIESVRDERLLADYYDFQEGNPILTFDRLLGDLQQVNPGKRLLFLVDEAEILRDKVEREELSGGLITYMASVLESRRVSFFFTGSSGLSEGARSEWRHLLGKSDYREITLLSRRDTMRLIQEPVAGRVVYGGGVIEAIYQLSYGHPFYTQVVCQSVVDYLNVAQRHDFALDGLDEVVRTFVNNPPPQLVYDWEQFSEQQQVVLALLSEVSEEGHTPVQPEALLAAKEDNAYPVELSSENLNVVLDGLDEKNVLERTEGGGYHFLIDLMRLWIKRNRSVWRLVEEAEPEKRSKVGVIAVAVAGVLVAVGAGFWFGREPKQAGEQTAAKSVPAHSVVTVHTEPLGARVLVDGEPKLDSTPNAIPGVSRGEHTFTAVHDDYHRRDTLVHVTDAVHELHIEPLRRKTGWLSVATAQTGVRIEMEGEPDTTVTAPVTRMVRATGPWRITLSKPGYRDTAFAVEIEDGETTARTLSLVENVGHLFVDSGPPGAAVFIDGQPQGVTPTMVPNLAVRRHDVRVTLKGHDAEDASRRIEFGRTDSVMFALQQTKAKVMVQSDPSGALVFVDDGSQTPRKTSFSTELLPGPHRFLFSFDGYDSKEVTRRLFAGKEDTLSVRLVQQFGEVRIAWPVSGLLYVDGELMEEGALGTYRLSAGAHTLETEVGGKALSAEVEVSNTHRLTILKSHWNADDERD